jgi:hypothetical protein
MNETREGEEEYHIGGGGGGLKEVRRSASELHMSIKQLWCTVKEIHAPEDERAWASAFGSFRTSIVRIPSADFSPFWA